MFQVLIVDDEPSSAEYLCNIIRLKCKDLIVAATAENGREGLSYYQRERPDLVISDVKMPDMDGLEMVREIRAVQEDAQILLISGYQEFEYVKAALKYGVSDYVLKPVTPAGLIEALEPMIRVLNQRKEERRKRLARSMAKGEGADLEEIRRCFPEDRYYLAVIRENGLPKRFGGAQEIEVISEEENTIFLYGRDEREALYICPAEALDEAGFYRIIRLEAERKKGESNFVTTVMVRGTAERDSLAYTVRELYRQLNGRLSIGVTQCFFADESQERGAGHVETALEKRLEKCLIQKDSDLFLKLLKRLLWEAKEGKTAQLKLERMIRHAAGIARRSWGPAEDVLAEEILLEDAFCDSGSIADLYDNLKAFFGRFWARQQDSIKLDSPEFLNSLKQTIEGRLEEEITTASLCHEFGISQSYFNMIFRKYEGESFHVYLRNARIARAKEILKSAPEIYIKDVAEMTGYRDQFYFSRIFRAVTGVSPTEYVERERR